MRIISNKIPKGLFAHALRTYMNERSRSNLVKVRIMEAHLEALGANQGV